MLYGSVRDAFLFLTYTCRMPTLDAPSLAFSQDGHHTVTATGAWHVQALMPAQTMTDIKLALKSAGTTDAQHWDLSQVDSMDYIGAQLLWNAWGRQRPAQLTLAPQHEDFFRRFEETGMLDMRKAPQKHWYSLDVMLQRKIALADHILGFIA